MGDETAEFVTLYKKKEQKKKENNKDSHSIYVVFKLKKRLLPYIIFFTALFSKRDLTFIILCNIFCQERFKDVEKVKKKKKRKDKKKKRETFFTRWSRSFRRQTS